jgi:hypothetical protein
MPDEPYRPMRDATDPAHKAIVAEAYMIRGMIVGTYAHIEFLLADVCMKAWPLPEYAHLRAPLPYKLETRIKAAEALFSSPGRLNAYYSDVGNLFSRLLKYEELRHFMAHGLLIVDPNPSPPAIQFQLWRATKSGAEIGTINTDVDQMRETANELALYSNTLIRIFHRVYIEQELELLG